MEDGEKNLGGGGWDVMLVKFRQVCGFFRNSGNNGLDFSDVLVKVCACIWRACLRFLPPTPSKVCGLRASVHPFSPRLEVLVATWVAVLENWAPNKRIHSRRWNAHKGFCCEFVFVQQELVSDKTLDRSSYLNMHVIYLSSSVCSFPAFPVLFFFHLDFFFLSHHFSLFVTFVCFFCGYPDLFESVLSCVFVFLWGGRLENSVFLLLLCSVVTFLIFFPLTQIFCFLPYSVLLNALLDCQLFLLPSCFPQLFVLCGDAFIVSKTSFFFCQTHLLLSPAVWYFVW